jgi:coenzyme PQQ precursor peptide PqqA
MRPTAALPTLRKCELRRCAAPVARPTRVRYFGREWPPRGRAKTRETTMAWMTPTLVEICIGLEINGYLPAEF